MGKPHRFISSVVFEPGSWNPAVKIPHGKLLAESIDYRTYEFNTHRRQLLGEMWMVYACCRGFCDVVTENETTPAGFTPFPWPADKKKAPKRIRPLGPAVWPPEI